MNRHYPALIHKDPDTWFGISFPDFPGCISQGETVEEALTEGSGALQGHADFMLSDGDPLPAPTPIADLTMLQRDEAVAVALVAIQVPGRSKRVQITIEESLLAEIDAASSNRSGFLAEAARARLSGHTTYVKINPGPAIPPIRKT